MRPTYRYSRTVLKLSFVDAAALTIGLRAFGIFMVVAGLLAFSMLYAVLAVLL